MTNPQPRISQSTMDIREMYKITSGTNDTWGVDGYKVPKFYHDSVKMAQDREIEETLKKGKLLPDNKKNITKRGHFLDDQLKHIASKLVSPAQYKIGDPWKEIEEKSKNAPKPKHGDRKTFLGMIFEQEKKNPTPGPNLYQRPVKTEQEIKEEIDKFAQRKVKPGVRPCFLDGYMHQSSITPGPGNFNDRYKDSFQWDLQTKLKINVFDKMKPGEWIKKHKESDDKKPKKDNLSLIHPYRVDQNTFGKLMHDSKDKNNNEGGKNLKFFGSSPRFGDMKRNKSENVFPGAGQYNLLAFWQGKDLKGQEAQQNDDKKKQFDYKKVNKGIQKSIYY